MSWTNSADILLKKNIWSDKCAPPVSSQILCSLIDNLSIFNWSILYCLTMPVKESSTILLHFSYQRCAVVSVCPTNTVHIQRLIYIILFLLVKLNYVNINKFGYWQHYFKYKCHSLSHITWTIIKPLNVALKCFYVTTATEQ